MTLALDTNILSTLWSGSPDLSQLVQSSLQTLSSSHVLLICAPVFAELVAAPKRDLGAVEALLHEEGMKIDWDLDPPVWRTAALAYQTYAARRRAGSGAPGPGRILADFVIGAHALHADAALLTLDQGIYRAAFPALTVLAPADL